MIEHCHLCDRDIERTEAMLCFDNSIQQFVIVCKKCLDPVKTEKQWFETFGTPIVKSVLTNSGNMS
jgi:hypothetical protein